MNATKSQDRSRIVLGSFLILAGTGHLTFARREFQAQVPEWVPMDKDTVVILSGYGEITLGMALVFLKKRKKSMGLLAAAFFALVFPGNIAQFIDRRDGFGLDTDTRRFFRLFLQPVLIAWAVYASTALVRRKRS